MLGEVFIFEKRPRWTPALQRQFLDEDVRVRRFTRLADLRREATASSRGVVLLEFAAGAADCLQFLGRALGRPGFPPVFVIGSDRTADLEWPIREFGATAFLDEAIPRSQLARLIRRQWQLAAR